MKDLLILPAHLLTTIAILVEPGGARAVVADGLLMKQQLLVINRSRRRAPNLSALDRFLPRFWALFLDPRRIQRAAVIIRTSTLLKFHDLLIKRKLDAFLQYYNHTRAHQSLDGNAPAEVSSVQQLPTAKPGNYSGVHTAMDFSDANCCINRNSPRTGRVNGGRMRMRSWAVRDPIDDI
jgi:hypothetical protein